MALLVVSVPCRLTAVAFVAAAVFLGRPSRPDWTRSRLRPREVLVHLNLLDWLIVAASLAVALAPALLFTRRAGTSTSEFFTSGRAAPWWLVGTSMVATTFSTDTPNVVADLVRRGGVAANWA